VDFLSAPSNFLVQWLRNFESKDLGPRSPSPWFSRTRWVPGARVRKRTRFDRVPDAHSNDDDDDDNDNDNDDDNTMKPSCDDNDNEDDDDDVDVNYE